MNALARAAATATSALCRLAVRAVVLLTTGPALLALTACTVSSVAIILAISSHPIIGRTPPGSAPLIVSGPAISSAHAARQAHAGGSAAAITSAPVTAPAAVPTVAVQPRPSASRSPAVARADEFANGKAYFAWITGVRRGKPTKVRLELARHLPGIAAKRYAAQHHLPPPLDDHIDIDRHAAVTVTVAPDARISIDGRGADPRRLPVSAFLAYVAKNLAVRVNGQLNGPLYVVTFDRDQLVTARQVCEP